MRCPEVTTYRRSPTFPCGRRGMRACVPAIAARLARAPRHRGAAPPAHAARRGSALVATAGLFILERGRGRRHGRRAGRAGARQGDDRRRPARARHRGRRRPRAGDAARDQALPARARPEARRHARPADAEARSASIPRTRRPRSASLDPRLEPIAQCESGGDPTGRLGGRALPRQVPVRSRDLAQRRRQGRPGEGVRGRAGSPRREAARARGHGALAELRLSTPRAAGTDAPRLRRSVARDQPTRGERDEQRSDGSAGQPTGRCGRPVTTTRSPSSSGRSAPPSPARSRSRPACACSTSAPAPAAPRSAPREAGAEVVGLDIAPELLRRRAPARREARASRSSGSRATPQALPFEDDSFDRVLSAFGTISAADHDARGARARARLQARRRDRDGQLVRPTASPAGCRRCCAASARRGRSRPIAPSEWGTHGHVRARRSAASSCSRSSPAASTSSSSPSTRCSRTTRRTSARSSWRAAELDPQLYDDLRRELRAWIEELDTGEGETRVRGGVPARRRPQAGRGPAPERLTRAVWQR